MPRVDFYVLEATLPGGRLKVACRIAEKAYLGAQRVAVLCADAAELAALDDLLWTFADGSFVPHERDLGTPGGAEAADCPVILACGATPGGRIDVIVNLGAEVPAFDAGVQRIAEIVDAEEARRAAGRRRFKHYRALGIEPQSHNLPAAGPL